MTDAQLYLAVGLPTGVALIGILVNVGYFVALNGRMTAMEARMLALETRVAGLEATVGILKSGFDLFLGKEKRP